MCPHVSTCVHRVDDSVFVHWASGTVVKGYFGRLLFVRSDRFFSTGKAEYNLINIVFRFILNKVSTSSRMVRPQTPYLRKSAQAHSELVFMQI